MQDYLEVLSKVPLFDRFEKQNILPALHCLKAEKKAYHKNDIILKTGTEVTQAGIILSGVVEVILNDAAGIKVMIDQLQEGNLFAQAPACAGIGHSLMQVTALTDCKIAFINISPLFSPGSYICPYRLMVMENLLKMLANENLFFNRKIQILTQRTIRGKLRLYLLSLARDYQADEFIIPFTRTELADYLFVDRSALSRELCRMRDEKLIWFERNRIQLLKKDF